MENGNRKNLCNCGVDTPLRDRCFICQTRNRQNEFEKKIIKKSEVKENGKIK